MNIGEEIKIDEQTSDIFVITDDIIEECVSCALDE